MTIKELTYDLKIKLDKVDSLQHENFIPAETDWMLNEAINIIVKQRFGINNSKRVGFEGNEKRIQDLKTLHVKCPSTIQPAIPTIVVQDGRYEIRLSSLTFPFLFLTRATAKAAKTGCGTRVIDLKETENDDFNDVIVDPFWKPSFEWKEAPVNFGRSDTLTDDLGSLYIYTNGDFTISEVYIEYIKVPNKVCSGGYPDINTGITTSVVECDLPAQLHSEIVDIAVAECARIISDPNFQQLKQNKLLVNE